MAGPLIGTHRLVEFAVASASAAGIEASGFLAGIAVLVAILIVVFAGTARGEKLIVSAERLLLRFEVHRTFLGRLPLLLVAIDFVVRKSIVVIRIFHAILRISVFSVPVANAVWIPIYGRPFSRCHFQSCLEAKFCMFTTLSFQIDNDCFVQYLIYCIVNECLSL